METHRASRKAELVRSHWEVENRLHRRLEVAFDEDHSRLRKDHNPRTCPYTEASARTCSYATVPNRWASKANPHGQLSHDYLI